MSAKNLFRWDHLEQLRRHTSISDEDQAVRDYQLIKTNLKRARDRWRACKKRSTAIRKKILEERAAFFASKLKCIEEKAICAIIKAKESKRIYNNIKEILGKQPTPLTQVDIINESSDKRSHITLTSREEIENSIMKKNRKHSLQSLNTPFIANPALSSAVNISNPHHMDSLLDGTFIKQLCHSRNLNK